MRLFVYVMQAQILAFSKLVFHIMSPNLGLFRWLPSALCSVLANKRKTSHWDCIPIEILDLISERLELLDCIRLRAVCRSWRSSKIEISAFPWLMLPLHKRCNDKAGFFDLSTGIIHCFEFPETVKDASFVASSKGWFLMARGTIDVHELFLFDPIRKIELPLPPIDSLIGYEEFVEEFGLEVECFIRRFVLSSLDASNCVAAVICNYHDALAICRPGATAWRLIKSSEDLAYYDLSFSSRDMTKLFVLVEDHWVDEITTIVDDDVTVKLIPMSWPDLNTRTTVLPEDKMETILSIIEDSYTNAYLSEFEDGLMVVYRMMDNYLTGYDYYDENDELQHYYNNDGVTCIYERTCRFLIFKVEEVHGRVRRTKLERLEDGILFVSSKMCTYTRTMKGSKRNCVFFLGGVNYLGDVYYQPPCNDNGILDMDTGRIERFIPSVSIATHSSMNWFQPNLQSLTISRVAHKNY